MADIKKLLNKKGWTGRELGIIELTNMCSVFRQGLEGISPVVPLVEKGQFQKMLNSIQDSYNEKIYNGYIAIHEWCSLNYNIRLANEQQAQLRFKDLIDMVEMAVMAEDVFRYEAQLPVIMTQKQFDDTVEEKRRLYLNGEEGDPAHLTSESLVFLVHRAIDYYAELLVSDPKKPNPLKPVRKKYVAEPISSPLIRARYNKAADNGYWMTEDGKRSDQMTEAEWQKAITTPKMAQLLEQMTQEESQTDASSTAEAISLERAQARAEWLYSGMDLKAIHEAEKQKDLDDGLGALTTYHLYEEFPEDLTKWDVLTDFCTISTMYENFLSCVDPEPEAYTAEGQDFLSEFREAVEAVLQDIDKKVYGGTAGLADLPLDKWHTVVISNAEMYDLDLYGYRAFVDQPSILFDGDDKATSRGIAILREDMIDSSRIDDRGHYIPPKIHRSFSKHGLDSFFSEHERFAENLDALESGRSALLDSYYYLKAFNLAIDMIAEYYDVPDLEVLKANTRAIEVKIDAINEMIKVLYMLIHDTWCYHDQELKERKLQVLREIFVPIDWKSIEIPAAAIEEARAALKDFHAFKDNDISDILFWRKPAANGEEADLHE